MSIPAHSTSDLLAPTDSSNRGLRFVQPESPKLPAPSITTKKGLLQANLPQDKVTHLRQLHDDEIGIPDKTLSQKDVDRFNEFLESTLMERNLWRKACQALRGGHKAACKKYALQSHETINEYAKGYALEAHSLQPSSNGDPGNEESTMQVQGVFLSADLLKSKFEEYYPQVDQAISKYSHNPTDKAAGLVIDYVHGLTALHRCTRAMQAVAQQVVDSRENLYSEVKMSRITEQIQSESDNRKIAKEVWDLVQQKEREKKR